MIGVFDSADARKTAATFRRLIRRGVLTYFEARRDILVTERQQQIMLQENNPALVHAAVAHRRKTWKNLVALVAADAKRLKGRDEAARAKGRLTAEHSQQC